MIHRKLFPNKEGAVIGALLPGFFRQSGLVHEKRPFSIPCQDNAVSSYDDIFGCFYLMEL